MKLEKSKFHHFRKWISKCMMTGLTFLMIKEQWDHAWYHVQQTWKRILHGCSVQMEISTNSDASTSVRHVDKELSMLKVLKIHPFCTSSPKKTCSDHVVATGVSCLNYLLLMPQSKNEKHQFYFILFQYFVFCPISAISETALFWQKHFFHKLCFSKKKIKKKILEKKGFVIETAGYFKEEWISASNGITESTA